jgi:hypothetical protein
MSSIKLESNASGTGIFTIASPNSNTNRTLTLPDATGTINTSGAVNEVPTGTVSAPSITFTGDTNTGIFSPAADTIAFAEGGVESMRIDSSGRVGIGTSAPVSGSRLAVVGGGTQISGGTSAQAGFRFQVSSGVATITGINNDNNAFNPIAFYTGASEAARIDSSGNVGIGTSSPTSPLNVVSASSSLAIAINGRSSDNLGAMYFYANNGSTQHATITASATEFRLSSVPAAAVQTFYTNATERMRIDSSGNVGIGTSSPSNRLHVSNAIQTGSNPDSVGVLMGAAAFRQSIAGPLYFDAGSGSTAAGIIFRDGSGYAERARITSDGDLLVAKTATDSTTVGVVIARQGAIVCVRSGDSLMVCNRLTNDGELIAFRQDSTTEGSISVSGTTVSYNGGNLSRWAQMPGTKDDTLVKGTVMSNLDEMNVYTKDGESVDNEQLNKVKVSDVEGDVNVAGVFVNWTYDDAHQVDEINMAMTGDMIIRIAQGVVVQKGDLLMSAGDGTAKPQDDDIVRSKTVAKVTSNHVTCTYADGSYCVPCVLMAC